jgi:hypothetical protein
MAHAQAAFDPERDTRIRFGRHEDLPAVTRLIHRANAEDRTPRINDRELDMVTDRGQLIVLQLRDDEIAAAACVAPGRGLVFLVIDPDVASPVLEHRMIGVADALCEAELGRCASRPTGARGRR